MYTGLNASNSKLQPTHLLTRVKSRDASASKKHELVRKEYKFLKDMIALGHFNIARSFVKSIQLYASLSIGL